LSTWGARTAYEQFQHPGKEPARNGGAGLRLDKDIAAALAEQFCIGLFDLGLQVVAAAGEAKLVLGIAIGFLFCAADAFDF